MQSAEIQRQRKNIKFFFEKSCLKICVYQKNVVSLQCN
jgi:hypothetical protein